MKQWHLLPVRLALSSEVPCKTVLFHFTEADEDLSGFENPVLEFRTDKCLRFENKFVF
jgi:hypothetical protein